MKKIIVARHGETDANKSNIISGISPYELNSNGIRQAEDLALQAAKSKITKIYTSEVLRAYRTAEIVSKLNNNIPVIKCSELNARSHGILEGTSYNQLTSQRRKEFDDTRIKTLEEKKYTDTDRESYQQILKRVCTFFNKYSNELDEYSLLITHATVIKCIFEVSNVKFNYLKHIPKCKIIKIQYEEILYNEL